MAYPLPSQPCLSVSCRDALLQPVIDDRAHSQVL